MDSAQQPVPAASDASDASALTRADVAWLAAGYRRGARRWTLAALLLTALGGLGGAAMVRVAGPGWGWSHTGALAGQAAGWVAPLGATAAAVRRDRRLRARHALLCPHCAHAAVPPSVSTVLTTGRCPACGGEIVSRDG